MDTSQWLLRQELFQSHDDAETGYVLVVGYDERLDMMLMLGRYRSGASKEQVLRRVVIKKEDAFGMARRLHVPMTALPGLLADKFSDLDSFGGLDIAEDILADILDYLLSIGVRYHHS